MNQSLIDFVRGIYSSNGFIPLHEPTFKGNEKKYLEETIDSTFVSSVGKFVDDFENKVQTYTGSPRAIATMNGTAALHTALFLADVQPGDLVITQALTFVATCNALHHMGALPVFIDVDRVSFGLCADATAKWLEGNAELDGEGECRHITSGKRIRAAMPMHTFGHPANLDDLSKLCQKWNLQLIEDAAESLGSTYKGQHTGTFGRFGALSFNGNKIITTGGGGMLLCQSRKDGESAKHVTTTAKVAHTYEFYHDEPGFNYRLPNLNAALGCAQMEKLEQIVDLKRQLAAQYEGFFAGSDYQYIKEPDYARSNYWLNAVICPDSESRTELLEISNKQGVMTRPIWQLMIHLPMFQGAIRGDLSNSLWAEQRIVNLPSTPVGVV